MSRGELSATRLSESVGEDVFGSYDELVLTLTPVNHTGPHYVDVSFREYAGNQLMMLTQVKHVAHNKCLKLAGKSSGPPGPLNLNSWGP